MSSGRAQRRLACLASTVGLLALLGSCADDSYAVVSVLTYSGSVSGVAQFRVHVGNGSGQETLYYPHQRSESLRLDTDHAVTFSVEFDSSRGGTADFEVEPLDVNGSTLAYGKSSVGISKGKVVNVKVLVVVGATRPESPVDAGVPSDSGDASTLSCDPYAPIATCGAGHTCGLICNQNQPAVGMCYAAGAVGPGSTCGSNNDCEPGAQCFTFTATGCSVMTCLKFCNHDDSLCGEQGSYCNVPIACGTSLPYSACSRPCDPTGTATTGCATGLACFVYAGETTDCACPGLHDVGASCSQNSGCNGETGCDGCRAGLSCIVPTGSSTSASGTCRPVCKLAAPVCPTGTTCHSFDSSTRQLYGFCQ
jgi:hypothetical protein